MELRLYNRLCQDLLGDFTQLATGQDREYQRLVEAYGTPEQTGLSLELNRKIRDWVDWYNRLQTSNYILRYYQILALYFTEHVLYSKRNGLEFQDQKALVYWMATGSGKTLLMHLNVLQYLEHIGGTHGFDQLQIILTTPGVNLIQQHEQELGRLVQTLNQECNNRIQLTIATTAALLNKESGFFNLPERHGQYRLVLVDEGHIGLSGGGREVGAFKSLRQELLTPQNSFLFEYSATYHGIAEKHVQEYEEQIVYDYNYYRFFKDGYGKDFAIQSIHDDRFADPGREEYENFMATFSCLEGKIQDYRNIAHEESESWRRESLFARPLLAFMGNTVVDPKDEGKNDEVSDIRKLLRFLALLTDEEKQNLANVFNGQVQGKLRLNRRPGQQDMIWLSWGEGSYWGLINVGNGEKFVTDCEGHEQLKDMQGSMLLETAKANIIQERAGFDQIDTPASPINVLIGSRKFAEGWNCFRVSIIGLINLGSSKGNKIIQIFGRGVRLHGQNGDGKRRCIEHVKDYETLAADSTPGARLRRLETLNVFSLKHSYLEKFLHGLADDLPIQFEYSIPLQPRPVTIRGRKLPFAEYSSKLKAPKVGRKTFQSPLRIVWNLQDSTWIWEYKGLDGRHSQSMPHFPITLDYRADQQDQRRPEIQDELRIWLQENAPFLPKDRWRKRMRDWEQQHKVQILVNTEHGGWKGPDIVDTLAWVKSVVYQAGPFERSVPAVASLVDQLQLDVLNKVRNTVINDINKRNYRLDEPIEQVDADGGGDFAQEQRLHFSHENSQKGQQYPDIDAIKKKIGNTLNKKHKQLRLDALEPKANFHVYGPLYDERLKNVLQQENLLRAVNTERGTPALLNPGESKFVRDLTAYLQQPAMQNSRYQFFLMRNEASLRSVGIYLQSELQAFFPDFVLWIVDETTQRTIIVLVDPKGQTGIIERNTLMTNEKVNIANNGHLDELATNLTARHDREFTIHSFILLRDSSQMGTWNGNFPSPKEREIIQAMREKNVFRLDWSETNEQDDRVYRSVDGQGYLDMMFEKIAL